MNSGEQTPEQRRLIRGACTLDGKDVAPGNLLPIAVHEGVSVAWQRRGRLNFSSLQVRRLRTT